jgi:MoxR-like ATPase
VQIAVKAPRQDPTAVARRLADNVGRALEGKEDAVRMAVVALLARGHLLVEDVPGVGKTTLARALARSVGAVFRRVQFTSDLMPADVLGGSVYDPSRSAFLFRPGPIFTQVLLADEINRTTPKTQSALLEAMEEGQVSIDGETHALGEPFFVVATQNPQDYYGTYPLPESQLDRFLVRMRIGYPAPEVERRVLGTRRGDDPVTALEPVVSVEELLEAQRAVDEVRVADPVLDYLHAMVLGTRAHPMLEVGASTRAALALERTTRAHALVSGRTHALPDDVQAVTVAVLAHRVRVAGSIDGAAPRDDAERAVRELLASVPVPL